MSSPRLLWRVLPLPARALVLASTAGLFLLAGSQITWARAYEGYQQRRAERAALAPILADARRSDLTYPQVVVSYPAYMGKAVYWHVTVASSTSSYAEGRPAWPIVWTNQDRVHDELPFPRAPVLARVAAVKDDTVYLDYLGRP